MDIIRGLDRTVRAASVEEGVLVWEKLNQWAPEEFRAFVVFQAPDEVDERGFSGKSLLGVRCPTHNLSPGGYHDAC